VRVEVRQERLRFARPMRAAYGTLRERDILVLALTDDDGKTGYGEAAPLEPYDGVSVGAARDALDGYRPLLEGAANAVPDAVVAACRDACDLPQALAAVDLALWDLAGRRAGRPVARLLSKTPATHVDVSATIDATAPQDAANAAAEAARRGFRTMKVKVGTGDDYTRVAAVRAAVGPEVALRLDANGAWTVADAIRSVGELARFDIELVEEPVHGVVELRAVREAVDVPVAMDETGALPGAIASGATDAVCLKIAACGGMSALLEQARSARGAGSFVYLASTFDGPMGIAAALHAAAALGPLPACGLATLAAFDDPPGALAAVDGRIAVPTGAGLGVAPLG
jgi:o-succinylbenzoate synthase